MLYLPRLYVYHADNQSNKKLSETFKVMERKLLRYIMNPAMIATWIFGIAMLSAAPDLLSQPWMHTKLLCVVLLSAMHGFLSKTRKNFANDTNTRSAKFYRYANEIPTILMIIIVVMVVVKPF